jgi:hypothetical protein
VRVRRLLCDLRTSCTAVKLSGKSEQCTGVSGTRTKVGIAHCNSYANAREAISLYTRTTLIVSSCSLPTGKSHRRLYCESCLIVRALLLTADIIVIVIQKHSCNSRVVSSSTSCCLLLRKR